MFTDDSGLPSGQQFFYAVAAVISGATGAQSAGSERYHACRPGAPANFALRRAVPQGKSNSHGILLPERLALRSSEVRQADR